jgi:hypothetical protein
MIINTEKELKKAYDYVFQKYEKSEITQSIERNTIDMLKKRSMQKAFYRGAKIKKNAS